MKIRKKTAIMLLVLTSFMVLSMFVFAADTGYDTSNDPLISKSYLDARLNELNSTVSSLRSDISTLKSDLKTLKSSVDSAVSENASLKKTVNSLKSEIADLNALVDKLNETAGTGYVTIVLKKGQKIFAKNNPVEFIVRTGSVRVVSPFNDPWAKQGLSDNTSGTDVFDGEYPLPNHVLLIPKGGDGRGVTVLSSDAYIMIRGDYEIEG